MKTVKFDTRTFISPPYIKCPKCGKESFGILMICAHHYCRRCRECFYPTGTEPSECYLLPKLDKKIIYIDQFAISNMMMALNPQTRAYQKGKIDEFWRKLFEKLDRLCKLQLIICPDSGFHTTESLVWKSDLASYFEPLKQMYGLLSHNVSFLDHETIKRFQICEHAKNWVDGKENEKLNLDAQSVTRGEINAWQSRLAISINLQYNQGWTDELRKTRERKHEGLKNVFEHWQTEKGKTFEEWFEWESKTFGEVTLQLYFNSSPFSVILIHSIHDTFRKAGIQDSEICPKTIEYLTSPSLKNVPFIKISSMLYASLARQVNLGRKEPPDRGMANDIEIISVLSPYCDAMFIDKKCHGYLKFQQYTSINIYIRPWSYTRKIRIL